MVYFEPNTFEWQTLLKTWMNSCSKKWINECRSFLTDMLEWVLPLVILYFNSQLNYRQPNDLTQFQMLDYVEMHGKNLLNPLKYNLINTTFNVIQMVIDEAIDAYPDDYQKFLISWIQAAAMFGIAWGMGGILNDESRKAFDHFHRKVFFKLLNNCCLLCNENSTIY